ncbi:MAG: hypothetical protein ACI4E1_07575 [Lachnospira sp.]
MKYKPYTKVITSNACYGVCAIYEPHPFRDSSIQSALNKEGIQSCQHTGINDNEWCWVYYDWIGNPIAIGNEMPDGEIVEKFTEENIGDKKLADYLNTESINAD